MFSLPNRIGGLLQILPDRDAGCRQSPASDDWRLKTESLYAPTSWNKRRPCRLLTCSSAGLCTAIKAVSFCFPSSLLCWVSSNFKWASWWNIPELPDFVHAERMHEMMYEMKIILTLVRINMRSLNLAGFEMIYLAAHTFTHPHNQY